MIKALKGQQVAFLCTFSGETSYLNESEDKHYIMPAGLQFTTPFKTAVSAALLGMQIDETKEVTLPAEDAFGLHDSAKIISVSIESDERIYLKGDFMQLKHGTLESKGLREGVVHRVHADHVEIDTNHPMAGQSITIKIKLVSMRK